MMPPSAHEAELLYPLVEHPALLRGEQFGHFSSCADQFLADQLGLHKNLRAQLFKRGPVDRFCQEQTMDFLLCGMHQVMQRCHILCHRRDQRGDFFLLLLCGINFDRRMFHHALNTLRPFRI